jgi:hypothetical protein
MWKMAKQATAEHNSEKHKKSKKESSSSIDEDTNIGKRDLRTDSDLSEIAETRSWKRLRKH